MVTACSFDVFFFCIIRLAAFCCVVTACHISNTSPFDFRRPRRREGALQGDWRRLGHRLRRAHLVNCAPANQLSQHPHTYLLQCIDYRIPFFTCVYSISRLVICSCECTRFSATHHQQLYLGQRATTINAIKYYILH